MKKRKDNDPVRVGMATEKDTALPVTVAMRAYYSSYHLWAARSFASMVEERELELANAAPVFDIQHRAMVTSAVFAAVAFLEAAVNEVLKDAADYHHAYIGGLGPEVLGKLRKLWQDSEGSDRRFLPTLKKYKKVLQATVEEPQGLAQLVDVRRLIQLRNHLTHFKPETRTEADLNRFERDLKSRFPPNTLMADSRNPFFPDKCLGAGCASWATGNTVTFVDDFFSQLRVVPNYQRVGWL